VLDGRCSPCVSVYMVVGTAVPAAVYRWCLCPRAARAVLVGARGVSLWGQHATCHRQSESGFDGQSNHITYTVYIYMYVCM